MKNIKKIVEDIHVQSLNGRVVIGDLKKGFWTFYSRFYTKLENLELKEKNIDFPTIYIPNYNAYLKKVENYLKYAREFYKKDQEYFDMSDDTFLKKLYLDLIINSTYSQQRDIMAYIDLRIKMLKNQFPETSFKIGEYLGANVESTISKNKSNLEAPYNFETKFVKERNEFEVPKIIFGVVDKTIYIYAIQNKNKKQDSSYAKKLDRYFRKVNKYVDKVTMEANVSPNALVALTMFISWARNCGYKDIIVPEFLPIRYDANLNAALNRAYDVSGRLEAYDIADRNQYNMTNKLLYVMYRYKLHFSDSDVVYDDVKGQIEIKITKQKVKNDNIIFDIDEFVDVIEYQNSIKQNI